MLSRSYHCAQPRPVASTPHLVWAAGHFVVFLSGLRFLLGVFTFNTPNLTHWYTIAYLGAIISYGVVVYKSFGVSVEKSLDCHNFDAHPLRRSLKQTKPTFNELHLTRMSNTSSWPSTGGSISPSSVSQVLLSALRTQS